jgi:Ca2+-transporting ATPase
VRGRARFEIRGLYRNDALCRHLENAVSELASVRSARANLLTGRLLVHFDPQHDAKDIGEAIEECLDRFAQPASRWRAEPRARPARTELAQQTGLPDVTRLFRLAFGEHVHRRPHAPEYESQAEHRWDMLDLDRVLDALRADTVAGLTAEDAQERMERFGANMLESIERRSDLAILVEQFNSLPVALLGVSAAISVATGGLVDAIVILGVVGINAGIGFFTERQAELTIQSLSATGERFARVLRGGNIIPVPARAIVPGDIVLLEPGTHVPADLRLLNASRLSIDESALTGESVPMTKNHRAACKENTPLGERANMAFMGTMVTGGNGAGIVVATAAATELGKIQSMVGSAQAPDTPMERQLDQMSTQLALLSGAVCAGVFGLGLLRGHSLIEMLKSSVSLAVAAVPEGLPAVATSTLALGIKKARQNRVAIRHLDAVETLGSIQVLCLDKTGTLTRNRMTAVAVHAGLKHYAATEGRLYREDQAVDALAGEELRRLFEVVSLCSEVQLDASDPEQLDGSPTEQALIRLARQSGIDVQQLRAAYPQRRMRHRAEGRPWMSTIHRTPEGGRLLAVKGSPSEVLEFCTHHIVEGERRPLTVDDREAILMQNERMAGEALRVLGGACRELPEDESGLESMTWLGLVGMTDPLRPGMSELMQQFHAAGIETVMITGDQSSTAQAIGTELGLSNGRPLQVLESTRLDDMDPELLRGLVKNVNVFARVSPAHKLQIVQALQGAGHVVAMTGDGINDGPALKSADIGVAMGESGTDLARSVSDVVLEDDNLHTMMDAVRHGRTIYSNIRKTIHFLLSSNASEIEVMLVGILIGRGQPLNPMQLLWINLITDIFPGLALSMEPPESDVLDRPPRDPAEPIIRRHDLARMGVESGVITASTIGSFLYGLMRYGPGPHASTMAFSTLTVSQLLHAISCRSDTQSIYTAGDRPRNRELDIAILGSLLAQGATLTIPALRKLLGTTPLGIADLLVMLAASGLPLLINEATKPGGRMHDTTEDNEAGERN